MRRVSKKVLAVAAVAALAFLVLFIVVIVTGDWATLLIGVISLSLLALLVVMIRGQREQREMLKSLRGRVNEISRRLDDMAGGPVTEASSRDQQIAQTAARFDWIARRQAEIIRLLDQGGEEEDGATSSAAVAGS